MTASSRYTSPAESRPAPCTAAKTSTATTPRAHTTQKAGRGRSRVSSAAAMAVAAGNRPTTTAPCEEGTVLSASAVKMENPNTVPSATTPSPNQCRRSGSAP